jgi:hypothetical protein
MVSLIRHPESIAAAFTIAAVMSLPFLQNYLSLRRVRARGERGRAQKALMVFWATIAIFFCAAETFRAFAP